jgi:alpha-L-rhamnosidase
MHKNHLTMLPVKKFLSVFCLTIICLYANTSRAQLQVNRLRCEYLENPLGIDITAPRLSWELSAPERGVVQTAYRILVASNPEKLAHDEGDLWNSGKISSDSSVSVVYKGSPLQSRMGCYWKVEVWDNKQNAGAWSQPAYWSMGLLHPADWSAKWTSLDTFFATDQPHAVHTRLSARYFRKAFDVNKKIKQAILYISGLGIYEAYINGHRVGDQVLSPDPTEYEKRVFYNTFNVTGYLEQGANAIGTILGNGRFFTMRWGKGDIPSITNFGYPKMLLQLEITYADGTTQKVVSDNSWKVNPFGPVLANNEYDGEDYDATKEMPGWTKPGYNDSQWIQAELTSAPCDNLEAQMDPLIKVMDSLQPKSIHVLKPDDYIFDVGQNMVGWVRLHIPHGRKGDTVTLRFAERLKDNGSLYTDNLRSAEATDHYIMKSGAQTWEPGFTYHGFRYVEITGYPGKPSLDAIQGRVVYDDLPIIGHFETSNAVINQIYHNAFWGIRGNYRGMPTDCPQRDERMGWLGDRAVGSYGESFIFDNNTLYAKWLQDIQDAQLPDGSIPDVAPTYWKVYSDNMTWPGAYLIITHMLYHQFENDRPMELHYASMKKWLYYMRDKYMKNDIMTKDTYGDWCMPPESPTLIHSKDPSRITAGDVLGTAFYYRMLELMQKFAHRLGKTDDEQQWADFAAKVRTAFNEKFLDTTNDEYSNNTATANLLALAFHLAPDSIRHSVFEHVVNTTMNDFHGHVSTGLVGAQVLMRGLTRNGRPDIAYKLATNTTYPSWGYMARHGATTIWELWNGNTANPAMNSGNHVMLLGDLVVWYYEDLAGIKSDDEAVGFKKIIMKPVPVGNLKFVNASYHSVHGIIKSAWRIENGNFHWQISVPANTTAEVYMPATSEADVTESGKPAANVQDVKWLHSDGKYVVYQVGSGNYDFESSRFKTN